MDELVHEHFSRNIIENGSKDAIIFNENHLSYKDLWKGSKIIADYISDRKVAPQTCVGVYMSKGPMAVMAIYGILMAGAAYVPLDIKNPDARIQLIIKDCGIDTIISESDQMERIKALTDGFQGHMHVILLGQCEKEYQIQRNRFTCTVLNPLLQNEKDESFSFNKKITPGHLASVLYTSGTSGSPKGVMITHKAITTFTEWAVKCFHLIPSDRCVSHAPFHFDLSLFDLFATHRAGASSVLIPSGIAGNPKAVAKQIKEQKITIWQSVPSILTMLIKFSNIYDNDENPMRHVLFAGERMPIETLKALRHIFKDASFHNIYGATETNDTFIYSISHKQKEIQDPLPIGRPLPGVHFRIFNNQKIDVDAGKEGELYVRAPTMMIGYRHNKEDGIVKLKDRNYDSSLFRYYKTGDIVKMLPDGNLHYCGRNDDIVKTSGNRINLLEVENCLQSNSNICESAVLAIQDSEIGHKLIAFVVAEKKSEISIIGMKMFCAKQLAKYAIPAIFVIKKSPLPKTSSGKIDKQLLKVQVREKLKENGQLEGA